MIVGKVENVTFIEHVDSGVDFCKICIEFDEHHIYGKYSEFLELIGKYVEYTTRVDIVNGQSLTIIDHLVDQYAVNTVDKQTGVKLIPKDDERAGCNFDISTLKFGDMELGVVALLTDYILGSSKKTKWIDCTIIDKQSKQYELRIFTKSVDGDVDAEEIIKSAIGNYIKFDVTFTKYGYQTNEIEIVNKEVTVAPEVTLALNAIKEVVSKDEELQAYCTAYNLLDVLSKRLDGDLGYELVYMAAELELLTAIENMSDVYDFKALRRAVICTRGYKLPAKVQYSKSILNVTKVLKTTLKQDKELVYILDPLAEEEASATKSLYYKVRMFARSIVDERRNVNEEINSVSNVNAELSNKFGGLL